MKKVFIFILSLTPYFAQSMNQESPASVIRNNFHNPEHVNSLLLNFSEQRLKDYRDRNNNNLMHVVINELINNLNAPDAAQLDFSYRPLLQRFANIGISVNEMNDDRNTPLFLVYYAQDKRLTNLEFFLENDLGGKETYFSIKPELRALKKAVIDCCCGCFRGKSKKSQE